MGELRIHIGPYKTASTTVQMLLSLNRAELLAHGINYPSPIGGTLPGHWRSAIDLFACDSESWSSMTLWAHWIMQSVPERYNRYRAWPDLLRTTLEFDGTTVWSSEAFCCAQETSVRRVSRSYGRQIDVVVYAHRPLSAVLISNYQEEAKRMVLPERDVYLRFVLDSLLRSKGPHRYSWMDPAWVAAQWRPHTDRLVAVGADEAFGEATVRAVVRELTGELQLPLGVGRRDNPSLSFLGVFAYQAELRARPPRFASSALGSLAGLESLTKAASGGTCCLRPETAELVDAAFPVFGHEPDEGARRALQREVSSRRSLSCLEARPTVDERSEIERLRRTLRRRFVAYDGAYLVIDQVRRARRQDRPIRPRWDLWSIE